MTYEIIKDAQLLRDFIDWLPDLQEGEKFYCCLFARKKYLPSMKSSDKSQLRRFLSDKKRLFNKIEQLEAKMGAYQIKGEPAPQEALVLYINPNPRVLGKASFDSIIQLTELLKRNNKNFNPHQEVMSTIQKSVGQKVYLDFDIDEKDFDLNRLDGVLNRSCLRIVQTRGGYHVLVKLAAIEPQFKKTFYQDMMALGVDQTGDQLLPVPGCTQGGFMPRFIDF
ncbi:MAG: hypothetical protein KTR30_09000 [Saprospiraceae bacterium]|nr:hypothetical protein [Saprospiraceae bacterium]